MFVSRSARFVELRSIALQLVPSRENRVGDCTHCVHVRPKSRKSSINFVPAVFRVHLVVRRSVWRSSLREPSVSRTLIQQRQAKFAWSQRRKLLTGPAGGNGKRQKFFWSRESSKVKHSIASFSRSIGSTWSHSTKVIRYLHQEILTSSVSCRSVPTIERKLWNREKAVRY